MSDWMEDNDGFPGRKRKVFVALSNVRRIFHADERVYSSLITANISSTATRVSGSENGAQSFRLFRNDICVTGKDGRLADEIEGRLGDCCEGVVLIDVRVVVVALSTRACIGTKPLV
jgi:hypothetical protein